jgi:hypothetical protein
MPGELWHQQIHSLFIDNHTCSDARSAQIVEDRIKPVLESGSKVGSSKPSLIVIDEIDGATGAGDNVSDLHHLPLYQ